MFLIHDTILHTQARGLSWERVVDESVAAGYSAEEVVAAAEDGAVLASGGGRWLVAAAVHAPFAEVATQVWHGVKLPKVGSDHGRCD